MTGEAVVLGLRTAKLPSRALAVLLDLVLEIVAFFACALVLMLVQPNLDGAAAAAIMLSLMVFFLVAVPVLVETFTRGKSLGKLALGLRVVRTDGGPVRFRHALVRGLVGFFEIIMLTGAPAAICSLISPEGRRLGDVFAGTLVVRERVTTRGTSAFTPPPPQLLHALGAELVRLDLSAVPDGLWLAIRQLLSRTGQLDPAVAFRMAAGLADELAALTRWPAPAGLDPASYLAAVLTERQRREWARAAGRASASASAPTAQTPPMPPSQLPTPPATPAAPAAPAAPVTGTTDSGFALPG